MKKLKHHPPRFQKDEEVGVFLIGSFERRKIKEEPKWNGYTWMYAFYETEMRCGEIYITKIKSKKEFNA